ncbi:MAG: DEAD/DEAH box helicase [Bdellovibrionota bacterium]|nr:MAG: DEAD/DEAH box helicase [Bdellovibrionota bacterium]
MTQSPSFTQFSLCPEILSVASRCGFVEPTPVQVQAIPAVLEGKDVLGLANTGTGKTAAFALPLLQRLGKGGRAKPRVLVLTPTRELAQQVQETFHRFGAPLGLRSCVVIGGVSQHMQVQRFRRGVDIIVACPGRILDHISQRNVDMSSIEYLVLDEADHMFDMGFLPDVRRVLKALPQKRQNLFFSATMPPEVRRLALELVRDPVTVDVRQGQAAETVAHAIYQIGAAQKTDLMVALLEAMHSESVLVFTRTKHRAKKLARDLEMRGFKATSLQGNLSQNARQKAMADFRSGAVQVLVATDIAARGIDVASISHVVNYDVPVTPEIYVHRIGRTGRAARTGNALTLVTPEDHGLVRAVERHLKQSIERRVHEGLVTTLVRQPSHQSSQQPLDSRRGQAGNDQPMRGRSSHNRSRGAGRWGSRPGRGRSSPGGTFSRSSRSRHSSFSGRDGRAGY